MSQPTRGRDPIPHEHRRPRSLAIPATSATAIVIGRACWVRALTLRETTGAASADVDFTDGGDAGAASLATITLNGGQSVREAYGVPGIYFADGLVLRVNAGTVRGGLSVVIE